MSASWFLLSRYLIWILGVQIDSIEQPIKRNSVGPGDMSHCKASSLYVHLDHCFVVFKRIQQSFQREELAIKEINSTLSRYLWCCWFGLVENGTLL